MLASEVRSPPADLERDHARRQRVRHKAARAADAPAVADDAPWTSGADATDLT